MSAFRGSSREPSLPQITAWSYSRLKTYLQCPAKAKYAYIDRLPEPSSPAMDEGQRVHKLAEDYLKGKVGNAEIPDELLLFAGDYAALREYADGNPDRVFVEHGAAFRKDLGVCDWFSKEAWLRVRYDALVINEDNSAVVIDLKTGKRRQEDRDQLSLFALATFMLFPGVTDVRTELWYCKDGALVEGSYRREDFEALKAEWLKKAEPMLHDRQFLPTPNALCKWCAFRKEANGPCSF